jgi:hypothetical protein
LIGKTCSLGWNARSTLGIEQGASGPSQDTCPVTRLIRHWPSIAVIYGGSEFRMAYQTNPTPFATGVRYSLHSLLKSRIVKKERLRLVMAHLRANTSAAKTKGLTVRALRIWRSTTASRKPADRNSPRKASPSLAPAIQANQSLSLALTSGGAGFDRINSAT